MNDLVPELLPEDTEAERSLLATVCAPGCDYLAREILPNLAEDDFVHPAHRALFLAASKALEANAEINALVLKDYLDQADDLHRLGGYPGLVEILASEEVGRPEILADILRRKSAFRKLIRMGAQLARQAATEEAAPEELLEALGRDLSQLVRQDQDKSLRPIADVAGEATDAILDRIEGRGETGLKVGFPRFDHIMGGFQPGNLVVLAARPGIGKTALALTWLLRAASKGFFGGFFSLEMSNAEVYERLIATHGRINLKAAAGTNDSALAAKVLVARDEIIRMPIFVNDAAHLTIQKMRADIDRHITKIGQKLDFVVVDYLQLMSSPEGSRGSKQNEAVRIGEISRGLKIIAKDYEIPVIVLSQLNREVEHRQGGRPQLSDLRDSGAIEQDADVVTFIHRKMTPVAEGLEPDPSAELIIAKHRNGPTGTISLFFQGEYATYREIEHHT